MNRPIAILGMAAQAIWIERLRASGFGSVKRVWILAQFVSHMHRQAHPQLAITPREVHGIAWKSVLARQGQWIQHEKIKMMKRTRVRTRIPARKCN